MAALADELKIGLIDLTPAYKEAAHKGRMFTSLSTCTGMPRRETWLLV